MYFRISQIRHVLAKERSDAFPWRLLLCTSTQDA